MGKIKIVCKSKVFLVSFALIFALVILQEARMSFRILGFLNCVVYCSTKTCVYFEDTRCKKSLVNPMSSKSSIWDQIDIRLSEKKNNFSLKKDFSIISAVSAAREYEQANAYVAVDYESGEVILSKNLSKRLPIASITKVMTAVVALDLASPGEEFVVSKEATLVPPTKFLLEDGEVFRLEELLNASLLTSANDCTEVIKMGIDQKYGSRVFIESMNRKAEEIGLKNSGFKNSQGFDAKGGFSSVEDVAILSKYAMDNYPLIKEIVGKESGFLPRNSKHKEMHLNNWNGLLGVYPGISGIKIGNTGEAKKTTAVLSERNGKKILVVLLGAPGVLERDLWASQILDDAFEKKWGFEPVEINETQLKLKYKAWKY